MHQNGICQENIIGILNSVLNQTQSIVLNENVQVHFQTRFLIKEVK